ncbi:unnamed protein product [Mucor fragilis]|jgi:hypothetical protein
MSSSKDNPLHSNQELANIRQGDDANAQLNNATFGSNVTDFSEPDHMDSRNQGDHDASGRFNPSGGFPPAHGQHFARQLAPILGGKHVDQDQADKDPIVDPSVPAAPTLGEKRQDEPDEDRIGLDPSQGKLKLD